MPLESKNTLGFDPDALRRKYTEERDKRLRADGNEQYREVVGDFARYLDDPYVEPGFTRAPLEDEVEVIVIGGGFGGLLAAARLREAGIEDIRIIEKGGDFGGTWYWNRYPGAQCDIEAYIYLPLLEELNYIPKEKYTHAPEILAHSRAIGEHYDLYRERLLPDRSDRDALGRRRGALDRHDESRRRNARALCGDVERSAEPAEAAGDSGRGNVQGPHVPHQPLGLRLHGRRPHRQPVEAARQAHRGDRHRRDRGAVRAASRRRR